jgi:urease accessory protein
MTSKLIRYIALAPLAFCSVASAHSGHDAGALAGLSHPFLGADHLLAMIAVGLWAAQQGGRARWLLPVSFVALLVLGAALAMAGIALPMVEAGVATSVMLLGLFIALAVKLPPALGAAMVGLFAIFHGYAHGAEMPAAVNAWQYGLGFVVSSAALHGLGLYAGLRSRLPGNWARSAGSLIALGGAWIGMAG